MTLQLQALRESMTAFLQREGVPALTAWPQRARERVEEALVVLDILEFKAEPSGFRNYLGDRFDPDTQAWQELYGQRAEVTFSLTVFSPADQGAVHCQQVLEGLAQALSQAGPAGLTVREFSWKKISYDGDTGAFCCEAAAQCGALLYAVTDEQGTFLEFEVRGEMIS